MAFARTLFILALYNSILRGQENRAEKTDQHNEPHHPAPGGAWTEPRGKSPSLLRRVSTVAIPVETLVSVVRLPEKRFPY
jgi:hypothetical protein